MMASAECENGSAIAVKRALRKYPSWVKWLCAAVAILTGVFCVVVFKWQNLVKVRVCDTCEEELFSGALYQTQLMFIGEFLTLFVYLADSAISARLAKRNLFDFAPNEEYYDRDEGPWYVWPICSLFDFGGTLMMMLSLKLTYASTVQMLKNVLILVTAGMQPVLMRRAVKSHEVIGVSVIFIAMFLSAIPALLTPDGTVDATTRDTVIGVILAVAGTSVQAVQLSLEEYFMGKGRSSPLRTVGFEGLGGLFWSFLAWPICQWAGLEDVTGSWRASAHSRLITASALIYLPVGAIFNGAGIAATQLGSGLLRAICFASRTPLVWLVSLAMNWQAFEYWSLAAAILFCGGFALYINQVGFKHGHPVHRWLAKPVHCCHCITDVSLDTPYDV